MIDEHALPGETEWVSWATDAGYVTLPDEERVLVQTGDELLIAHTSTGCTILAHVPAVRH